MYILQSLDLGALKKIPRSVVLKVQALAQTSTSGRNCYKCKFTGPHHPGMSFYSEKDTERYHEYESTG